MMKKKRGLCVFIIAILFLVGCSPATNTIEDFLSIADLVELQGIQSCSWDSQGDDNLGIYASKGTFDIDNGEYYFENEAESYDGTTTRYAYYDGQDYHNWNDVTVPGAPLIVQKISNDKYQSTVLETLGLKVWFNMHHDFDYGITCQEVSSVTLQTPPSDASIVNI